MLDADLVGALAGPVERDAGRGERGAGELADAGADAGCEHIVVRDIACGDRRHRRDVVRRIAEVAAGLEVAERELAFAAEHDTRDRATDLARDEGLVAPFRFVVEQDRARCVQAVARAPGADRGMREQLGHAVRRARREWGRLVLRRLRRGAENLRTRGEHETRGRCMRAQRLEQVHRARAVRREARAWIAERLGHARLAGEVEHGVGRDVLDRGRARCGIGCIERGQAQSRMRRDAESAQSPRVDRAPRAMCADHVDARLQQLRRQQCPVLPADARDEGALDRCAHAGRSGKLRSRDSAASSAARALGANGCSTRATGRSSRRQRISAADSLNSATTRRSNA